VAAGAWIFTRYIYVSTDSGATWTTTSAPNLSWYCVASSADGTKLVAVPWQTNVIYTSSNGGANWTPNPVPNSAWYAVGSSADGNTLVAVVDYGGIYTSTNSGASWTPTSIVNQNWRSVASSADGVKWVAVGFGGIYTSTDSGQTWLSNNVPEAAWASVGSSADGSKLVAVAATGQIYLAQPSPPTLALYWGGASLRLSWPSTGIQFDLQQNPGLSSTGWTTIPNPVVNTNGRNQLILAPTNRQSFFRLKSH
jgi:photosystem II stability/assembly factor-like uncharacterized protein